MIYSIKCFVEVQTYTRCTFSIAMALIRFSMRLTKVTIVEWLLSGVPDYFGRNKISSGGDLSHYSSASLY